MPKSARQFEDEISKHPNVKARIMPHNNEAEAAVLGCILIDRDASVQIIPAMKKEDFYSRAHSLIFEAMEAVYSRNEPVDFITLTSETEARGTTEAVGGVGYLSSLTNTVPSAANHKHYREIVQKNSLLRDLITSSQKVIDCSYAGDAEDRALQMAEAEIFRLAERSDTGDLTDIKTAAAVALKRLEDLCRDPKAQRGITTGFKGLNRKLNGLQRGDLVLIAARPAQGKTSIGMNIIQNAALSNERKSDSGKPKPYSCAVFSLEMPAEQLAKRMVCSVGRVDMTKVNSGTVNAAEWKRLMSAKARLDKSKIFIYDSSMVTPMELLSRCRRLKREHGLDLVMIDYLQLMTSGKRTDNRQQEVSDITRTLKIAARELDVPILLLSQLSREVEKRNVKRPQMSDLRESGAIEQDADIIIFIYREHPGDGDPTVTEAQRNQVELIIAKHRNGETGSVDVKWEGQYVSFADVDNSPDAKSREENIPAEVHKVNSLDELDEQFAPPPINADTAPTDVDGDNDGDEPTTMSEMPPGMILKPSDDDDDIF